MDLDGDVYWRRSIRIGEGHANLRPWSFHSRSGEGPHQAFHGLLRHAEFLPEACGEKIVQDATLSFSHWCWLLPSLCSSVWFLTPSLQDVSFSGVRFPPSARCFPLLERRHDFPSLRRLSAAAIRALLVVRFLRAL